MSSYDITNNTESNNTFRDINTLSLILEINGIRIKRSKKKFVIF